jgi:ferric-dicitrate binding protein FerR (iron transport regulator)
MESGRLMMGEASTSIDEQAVRWFVRLRDEEVASRELARFAAWLAADPRHRQAWREVEALRAGLDRLGSTRQAAASPPATTGAAVSATADAGSGSPPSRRCCCCWSRARRFGRRCRRASRSRCSPTTT